MATIELQPIRERTSDYDEIEAAIIELFKEHIYKPLMIELPHSKTLQNSMDDLLRAISSGRISYAEGQFTGRFSATISRELYKIGAVRDRRQGGFRLARSKLPYSVRAAISTAATRMNVVLAKIQHKISKLLPAQIAEKLDIEDLFDTTLWKVEKDFNKTLRGITVAPQLTKDQMREIAKKYTENMKLYIKDWTEQEIIKLRHLVEERSIKGLRYEDLTKIIQSRYQVGRSKAKFLARQETSLMMSQYKETRYRSAGVDEYVWCCVVGSPNHPVRPLHKKQNGKKFRFDNPPVVTETGDRKNPGQDFNCRCFAKPLVRF